jgi:hypothetical protein
VGKRIAWTAAVLCAVALAGCTPATRETRWASVRERTPAFLQAVAAYEPSLAAAGNGRIALTWVTRDTAGADVWIAVSPDGGDRFGPRQRINLRRGTVSSYPESRPVAAFGPSGVLVVAWASAREGAPGTDDVVARASADGGQTFGPEVVLNDDHDRAGPGYHGFLGLDVTPTGRAIAAWLDGRSVPLAPGEAEPPVAEIWASASDDGGAHWSANVRVASGVCPCCRPALRASTSLVAVAYRGVRESGRDPRLALSRDGGATWTLDTLVSADGWRVDGCPVAGPALSLSRDGGWAAWSTGAPGREGVHARSWNGAGGPAGPALALDDTLRDGAHPMLAAMGPVTVAGMVAAAGNGRRVVALRLLTDDHAPSPWLLLGAHARSATLAAADASHALAAWLEQGDSGPRLRLVRLTRR